MNQYAVPYRPAAASWRAKVPRKPRRSSLILGFLVMICLPPTIAGYAGTLLITPYRLYMLALFPYLSIRLFSDKTLKAGPADIFVLLYGIWTAFCAIRNLEGGTQRAGQTILETIGAYMLARVAIRSMADILYLIRILFIASMVAFVLAIPEAITHYKFLLAWTSDITRMPYYQYAPGTDVRLGLRRPQAFFANPILYGLFCASTLSLVWYTIPSKKVRLVKGALLGAATFLALSSGPLLAFNVQVVMIAAEAVTKKIKQRATIAIAILGVATLLLNLTTDSGMTGIIVNHLTFNSGSAYNRVLIWQWGIYNIKLHPITGLDSDNWIRPSFMKSSCDDFWIAITMNGGIPCLVFLLIGIAILLRKVGRLDATRLPPIFAHVRTAWLFSFVAFAFTGFSVMFFGALQPFFFFMIGLGGAIAVIYEKAALRERPIRNMSANGAPILRNAPRPIYPPVAGIRPRLL